MHAVLEPHVLRQLLVVELERRRHGSIEDIDSLGQHLDLAADEIRD